MPKFEEELKKIAASVQNRGSPTTAEIINIQNLLILIMDIQYRQSESDNDDKSKL